MDADDYAADLAATLRAWDATRPRHGQRRGGTLGVSDIGGCHEHARRILQGDPASDVPQSLAAQMGTAIHAEIAAARQWANPRLICEQELAVTLPSGVRVVGHPDEIDPDEPSVTDWKTTDYDGLARVRRYGCSDQQRYQRHLYYAAAHQAGLVPEEGTVRNVWLDRSGRDPHPHVEQEPYDAAVVAEADNWLADVVYAARHGEESLRDRHYDWCREFCEFFTACRLPVSTPEEVVTDEQLVASAEVFAEAAALRREWERVEAAARRDLEPLRTGTDGDVTVNQVGDLRVRWTRVHATNPYWRLAVEPA